MLLLAIPAVISRRHLTTAAKFLLPAAIIGFLLYRIEPHQWEQLSSQPKDYGLLIAAFLVALAAVSLSFVRWCLLVRCQGIELTMTEAFRLGAIGFLLSFVSAGSVGGDVFKAVFLARRRPGKRIAAVASVLVDRGCGLYALVLLVAIALLMTDPPASAEAGVGMGQIRWATAALFIVGTGVLLLLVLGGKSVDRGLQQASRIRLVGPVLMRIGPPLRMFHSHSVAFGAAILMSVGVQGMLAVSIYLIARSLYVDPPTLAEHFVVVPIAMLVSALPITPAGIGLLEVAIETLYQVIPSNPTAASGLLVALLFEFVKVIVAILGTLFYWTANAEVRDSLETAEAETHPPREGPQSEPHGL